MEFEKCAIMSGFRRSGHIYRGEYPTLIYPCRRVYHEVMMQQQGFVICDVPEVNNLSLFPTLTAAIFTNGYVRK